MEEVASVVWAVELLREESPEHCCLGLEKKRYLSLILIFFLALCGL